MPSWAATCSRPAHELTYETTVPLRYRPSLAMPVAQLLADPACLAVLKRFMRHPDLFKADEAKRSLRELMATMPEDYLRNMGLYLDAETIDAVDAALAELAE